MADIVIANILCEVIVRLAPVLRHALREDGVLLLSGILDKQVKAVRAGFGSGIEFEIRHRDQWCLMIGNIKVGHTQVL
jgi:ribosomal protein L11 methyltransferase